MYCDQSKFILKIDDDMVINVKVFHEYFLHLDQSVNSTRKLIAKFDHGFVHPARFIHDKHYVSREEYAPCLWPEYCWVLRMY